MSKANVTFSYETTLWEEMEMDLDKSMDEIDLNDEVIDRLRIAYPEGSAFTVTEINFEDDW